MKKKIYIVFLFTFSSIFTYAWGHKGHEIVAEIANKFITESTRDSINKYLDGLTFEQAATWMDDVKSDDSYNFMKTWHYVNIEKGKSYIKTDTPNIINQLEIAIANLRVRKSKEETKRNLLIVFHLIGDLHQPLHAGYANDRGGNSLVINSNGKPSNLHKIWDSEIIEHGKINAESVLILMEKNKSKINSKIDVLDWLNESRNKLDVVYEIKDNSIDRAYFDKNTDLVKMQLFLAGNRLAIILNEIFSVKK